ncbi:MAG: hypothetical protein K9G58_11090 [Bacteroidales bacterium]|nr:hypothetical protein [Bacteroidales bacterium]MCF8388109.1 hypothetical protein [Bacteroidales bacterium]MCF8398709.1 hypothetical protein [Bacteroidales bacterium]
MPDNYFYFKIPFRTSFSLNEGNILQQHAEYQELLKRINKKEIRKYTGDKDIPYSFSHLKFKSEKLQFESVHADSSMNDAFSPCFLEIKAPTWFEDQIIEIFEKRFSKDELQNLSFLRKSCKIELFRNTFATMECIFQIDKENHEISLEMIKKLEDFSNEYSGIIIKELHESIIEPLYKLFRSTEKHDRFFCIRGNHTGFPDIPAMGKNERIITRTVKTNEPLWVSRALIIGKYDDGFEDLFSHWIVAMESKEGILGKIKNNQGDEKNHVYLGWMHSIMLGELHEQVIQDAFFSLGLAQYYYTIFDSLNQNLSQIIGISNNRDFQKRSKPYKKLLEDMIYVTDQITVNYADILQGLQPNRTFFFEKLVEQWTIDNIMENVRKKINICKDNMKKIYQKRFNKSQRAAEILLFFISGFAILDFLSGLSEFIFKPESISRDVWGIYNLVKWAEPNTMMWFGLVIFLLVLSIYLMNQTRKG